MPTIAKAPLTEVERRALERLIDLLRSDFGPRLHAVWLYGSRARGERAGAESDVDVLVVVDREQPGDLRRSVELAIEAAEAEGANPVAISTHVYGTSRLSQRREIASFFMQEVDRDKLVLYGDP